MAVEPNAAVPSVNPPMGRRAWLGAKFRAGKKAAAITLLLIGSINAVLYALELSYPIQRGRGGKFEFDRLAPHWIADVIYSLNIGGLILSWDWVKRIEHGSDLATWAPELIVITSGTVFWSVCVGAVVLWIDEPRKRASGPSAPPVSGSDGFTRPGRS